MALGVDEDDASKVNRCQQLVAPGLPKGSGQQCCGTPPGGLQRVYAGFDIHILIQDSGQRISYREFGDAPNDDLIELQTFARRVRRGQRAFRDNLLLAYGSECSITGEGPEEVLEAIHIVPHAESGINELDNGLLMRADLHHLFDDGLLSINPDTKNIEIDERLLNTSYWQFNGVRLRLRVDGTQISSNYLRQRVP